MKIGYYCESSADRAALQVFTAALLGQPPEPISMDLEAHSVPGFFGALDGVFRGVHYRSDAEGLVVVVDADHSPIHETAHDQPGQDLDTCRLCQIRKIIARARNQLKPRHGSPLRVAIGLAVPAIEGWLLVGKEPQVGEAAWLAGMKESRLPFAKPQLKRLVYGTERPSVELLAEYAEREAKRIAENIQALEDAFPAGFGQMAQEIRSWRPQ